MKIIPMHFRSIAFLFATFGFAQTVIAAEEIYVREYVYQASEADSKLSARTIALQELKRLLLSELGTHVSALVKVQKSSDGNSFSSEQIETLSAGVTRVDILDEKWNGVTYVLKAQIKADPAEVLKSLNKMIDADKKSAQLSQLGGEVSALRSQNMQIAESLTQSKKDASAALAEIARLKLQLAQQQTDAARQTLQTDYQKQVDQLTINEWVDSAWKLFNEGDKVGAFRLWQKAAKQGEASAQFNLGLMYGNGEGVVRDAKQAVYWYRQAAEQGVSMAQFNLGLMYGNGEGVARDAKQAVYWWQKAAEQGVSIAQFNLGVMYGNGEGVARDAKQAVYWYRQAAEQGYAVAQFNLGVMYGNGEGVARDAKQAVYWYRQAADQGDADAQLNLGMMYVKGEGVVGDYSQAKYWWQKAAEQGHAGAIKNLKILRGEQ